MRMRSALVFVGLIGILGSIDGSYCEVVLLIRNRKVESSNLLGGSIKISNLRLQQGHRQNAVALVLALQVREWQSDWARYS